ncbi:MAG: cupin domain-containing protein [Flavobacterium sp.]|nr:MAG: cupin domain-containing protein [Flavobacterium sp.]
MNLQPYIASGILELYVLDLLSPDEKLGVERMLKVYPILKQEVLEIENALEHYANANAIQPSKKLENDMLEIVKNLTIEQEISLSQLPVINQHSNYLNWMPLLEQVKPVQLTDGIFNKVLQHNDQITQVLVVSEINIPEEIHEDEHESFLILEGNCECIVNGKSRFMGPGDFMEIPLHEPHDVILKSKQVTAILQRVKCLN